MSDIHSSGGRGGFSKFGGGKSPMYNMYWASFVLDILVLKTIFIVAHVDVSTCCIGNKVTLN